MHDLNIGSIARSANAFLAGAVHIVGRRRWNERGAMVANRHQHVLYHETIDVPSDGRMSRPSPIVAVDNLPGAVPVDSAQRPGAASSSWAGGPRVSPTRRWPLSQHVEILQFSSTRSINAAAAAEIVMHEVGPASTQVADKVHPPF